MDMRTAMTETDGITRGGGLMAEDAQMIAKVFKTAGLVKWIRTEKVSAQKFAEIKYLQMFQNNAKISTMILQTDVQSLAELKQDGVAIQALYRPLALQIVEMVWLSLEKFAMMEALGTLMGASKTVQDLMTDGIVPPEALVYLQFAQKNAEMDF